jgi:hypothetical protein
MGDRKVGKTAGSVFNNPFKHLRIAEVCLRQNGTMVNTIQ